jgi:LacI family transcriptional regulator
MSDLKRVALLIETSRSYGRGVLTGVRRYLAQHGPWSVYLETRALDSKGPPWLRGWKGDGLLTRTGSAGLAKLVRAARVPVVELRSGRLMPGVPYVGMDNHQIGTRVAEHLLERGFRRLAVYTLDTEDFFIQRCDNFIEAARKAGCPCEVLAASEHRERPSQWERHQEQLTEWVRSLAKPVGIMACTDQLGFWLLDACLRAGVAVPEELAVVGVEDDESLCSFARPPMSSLRLNPERVGMEAASLLVRMMRGKPPPRKPVLIPPQEIVVRQSSDVVAIEDPDLAAAVRFVRERACSGISVEDVVRVSTLSRSSLERGFRRVLGRSPNEELRRARLAETRRLLSETDLTLTAIRSRTGFTSVPYLCESFKCEYGVTPTEYRNTIRRDKIV